MKVGFYQFNPLFGEKDENLSKVRAVVQNSEADLLVLPEFFATGYQFISHDEVSRLSEPVPQGDTCRFLSDLSREKGIYIAAGLPETEGNTFYNSAVLTGPEGFIGLYRKTHLYSEETLYFTPGDTGFRVWDTGIGKIGIMVCFDWFFPESMRALSLKGAEVVAHPSNLVMPYCPDAMQVRCLENRVYAITANRTGIEKRKHDTQLTFIGKSEIVSPGGDIIVRAGEDEEVIMISEIDPSRAQDKKINPFNDIFKDRRSDMY
jgi:predicted amidohydrolase